MDKDMIFKTAARKSFEGLASYNSGYEVGVNDTLKCLNILYNDVYEELDPGWKKAFGKELIFDLLESLHNDDCIGSFTVSQVKEKFGELRLYFENYGEDTTNVIEKYTELSKYICGNCGKPAKYITSGWVYPLCEDCIQKINDTNCKAIEEAYDISDVISTIDKIKNNY
jgi:rubrerythrin